jgi:hypothetical protein
MAKKSALPIVAGGAALILLSSSGKKKKKSPSTPANRPRWGVRISKDCKTVEIVDPKMFSQFMYGAYDELISVDPSLTLMQVTDALFGEVAPNCSGFPEQPESDEVAELFAVIARNIASFMVTDQRTKESMGTLLDEATQISFVDWYRWWRNYPSPDIPDAPSAQVVFSSDFSNYEIGGNWFEEIVRPFVQEAHDNGRLDTAFEDYVNKCGVQVGKFTTPVQELPQDKPTVQDFLKKLEEAINQAASEVFTG